MPRRARRPMGAWPAAWRHWHGVRGGRQGRRGQLSSSSSTAAGSVHWSGPLRRRWRAPTLRVQRRRW
eukprot:11186697-Lingulodinium_polyedra.AAC.1